MSVTRVFDQVGRKSDHRYGWARSAFVVLAVVLGAPLLSYGAGPVQYWAFDDGSGSTAVNSVAGGNAGELVNFAGGGWSSDKPAALSHSSGALMFDAWQNQYVDAGELGLSSVQGNHAATVSVWIKPRNFFGSMRLFQPFGPPLVFPFPNGGISFSSAWGNGTLMGWHAANEVTTNIAPTGAIMVNQWMHLAFVWRGGEQVVYMNGTPVGGINMNFEFDRDLLGSKLRFGIGAKFYQEYGDPYDGLLDDFAIWDDALPAEAIRELAAGASPLSIGVGEKVKAPVRPLAGYLLDGNALDSRGKNPGTVMGEAGFVNGEGDTPFAYAGNSALSLDGVDNGVLIPDAPVLRPGTGEWTVSLWVKAAAADQQGSIIAKRMADQPFTQLNLLAAGSNPGGGPGDGKKAHLFMIGAPSMENWWEVCTYNDLADGQWHHVALALNGGACRPVLYIDGAECPIVLLRDTGSYPLNINCTEPWAIGFNGNGGYFNGVIDEVGLWNTALTGANIAWLASHSLSAIPPPGSLISIE